MWGYGWFSMAFMWIGILLGIVAIIAALVALAWWLGRSPLLLQSRDRAAALDTLARRYAASEMDEATFQRMRGQIQGADDHEAERPAERQHTAV